MATLKCAYFMGVAMRVEKLGKNAPLVVIVTTHFVLLPSHKVLRTRVSLATICLFQKHFE